ncbi:Re/Si-specific NAD(P)(+) transhydrogenase subunit alpha [Pendulispora albinea]|uniref:proton-translocating NAD(P)(+) transhydrogenase n=1 Tax=Pendulispora albinea TaxID=2741071 RepID=A0ABZ2LKN3_9BACT
MRVGVPREVTPGEKRVPLVADSVKRLASKKIDVSIESGAGTGSCITDEEFRAGGASVEPESSALYASADVVLRLRVPNEESIARLREGSTLIAPLFPLQEQNAPLVRALAARKVTTIAVDMIPRTTVAQMMDVLSSQATIAGYYAVLMASAALPRFFPMLMTAAGTIAPARVLVLGAGVAGLQAIGTAKRLGAVVEAFDVRAVVKEQVESLGARFVQVESGEDAQAEGGYAKETSEEYKKKQAEAIARHVKTADVVIATALIPGKRAPVLVTEEMVQSMKPGSVIVDLAAEQQGNCALTEPGQTVVRHGVSILGELDLPSRVAIHASQMYARNMEKLLLHVCNKDGALHLDPENEITRGCLITVAGDVVHPKVKERL